MTSIALLSLLFLLFLLLFIHLGHMPITVTMWLPVVPQSQPSW